MFEIDREHPDYRAVKTLWPRYRDLYAGGEQLKSRAEEYLITRLREPVDVYSERLTQVFYENYVGSIIDWYAATLFRREPVLTYEGSDDRAREFFNRFSEDCDVRGTHLSDFFRKALIEALVAGRTYVTVDFPREAGTAGTRAEEDERGLSRGFLSQFPVESLINWSRDDRGDFDWVVLRTERMGSSGPESGHWEKTRRWTYYDRERFRIYEQREGQEKALDVELIDEGLHGLAKLKQVPVFEFGVSEGMWLMNKAALLQIEHFNKSNALAWSLTMGLFAMPVVYSDRSLSQVISESYYLHLGSNDRFGWTEPEGHVYEIALRNLERLKEEIYRVCYVTSQSGGSFSKNSSMSGLSKQRDYVTTQEVLRGYGDRVKDSMKRILRSLAAARQDELELDVSGLDEFDIGDFSSELTDATQLLSLGACSPTLRQQVLKKLSMKYLCDVRQSVKDQIAREIDGL